MPLIILKGKYHNKVETEDGPSILETPYLLRNQHYIPSWKGMPRTVPFMDCSAGIVEKRSFAGTYLTRGNQKCVGCHQAQVAKAYRDGNLETTQRPITVNFSSISRVYVILVLAYFHKVDTGRKNKNGYTIYEHEHCRGASCRFCDDDAPRYFGQYFTTSLNSRQSEVLDTVETTTIENSCNCGGEITTIGFVCPLCDHQTKVDWNLLSADEKEKLLYVEQRCKKCKKSSLLNELITCSKCDTPRPLTLHDAVLWLSNGTADQRLLQLKKHASIDRYLQYLNKKEYITEEIIEEVKQLCENPPDISSNVRILDLPFQARYLGVPNPFMANNEEYEEYEHKETTRKKKRFESFEDANEQDSYVEYSDDDIPF